MITPDVYVIAQRGNQLNFLNLCSEPEREYRVGEVIDRMPVKTLEKWVIVKVFTIEQSCTIEAIILLMGHVSFRELFDITSI